MSKTTFLWIFFAQLIKIDVIRMTGTGRVKSSFLIQQLIQSSIFYVCFLV
jgi:hypothetical protein